MRRISSAPVCGLCAAAHLDAMALPRMSKHELEEYVRSVVTGFCPSALVTEANIDALAVNTLRHRHTDYDTDQSTESFLAAGEEIAEAYPHLAAAVDEQVRHRLAHDAVFGTAPQRRAELTPEQLDHVRRERAEASVRILAELTVQVGDVVTFARYGREHTGQVVRTSTVSLKVRVTTGEHEAVTTVYGTQLRG